VQDDIYVGPPLLFPWPSSGPPTFLILESPLTAITHCAHWYFNPTRICTSTPGAELIDFCIISTDLFQSVPNSRVKRRAELSTGYYLFVWNFAWKNQQQRAGLGGASDYSRKPWWTRMWERPLQTAHYPFSDSFKRNGRFYRKLKIVSGSCHVICCSSALTEK